MTLPPYVSEVPSLSLVSLVSFSISQISFSLPLSNQPHLRDVHIRKRVTLETAQLKLILVLSCKLIISFVMA